MKAAHFPSSARGGWCVLAAGLRLAMAAEDPPPSSSSSAPTHTVGLEYREAASGIMTWGLSVESQAVVFRKEPDFGSSRVLKRFVRLGDPPAPALALAWHVGDGKLYLDLNRNLDLTDDANGMFTSDRRPPGQTFANVRIPGSTADGLPPTSVDLVLYDYGQNNLGGTVSIRGYGEGRIELGGRAWQIGVIQKSGDGSQPSHLLLRPWERRDAVFSVNDGSLDALDWPARLFFEGHAYDLKWQPPRAGAATAGRLEWRERPVELGTLKLAGRDLGRVVLTGKEMTALLLAPGSGSEARVPVGTYERQALLLQAGESVAYRDTQAGLFPGRLLKITSKEAAVLAAGGPLTNQVSITRRGRSLVFNYQLVGADGAVYRLAREDRSRPPEFVVRQGPKQLATGKFEFG